MQRDGRVVSDIATAQLNNPARTYRHYAGDI